MVAMRQVVVELSWLFALAAAWAYPFKHLWNYAVVAAISGTNPINYTQSVGLLLLLAVYVSTSRSTTTINITQPNELSETE